MSLVAAYRNYRHAMTGREGDDVIKDSIALSSGHIGKGIIAIYTENVHLVRSLSGVVEMGGPHGTTRKTSLALQIDPCK
jgi:hypothetical protein